MKPLFVALRLVFAGAIAAAVIGQLATSVDYWRATGITGTVVSVVNFFSFFTIESNVAAAVVLVVGAVMLVVRRGDDSPGYTLVRASVVTYMVVTGIVYNLLLRGIELPQGSTLGWSNEILHVVAPVYLLVDWIFAPRRTQLHARRIWTVLVFPIAWVAYTLVRGPLTTGEAAGTRYWYPYPFLDPNNSPNGYLSVAFFVLLIAAVIGLSAAGVLWVSRRQPTGS
ncbi:MAG: hypothetical protein JWM50_1734 [Microbacteriaceae bacterium]|jgi:hypothetical protein|nr:hypothetical protein [Microbacteriaceae bacterium]